MTDLVRWCTVCGGLLGAVAVAAGAFGAHGLKAMLEASGQADNWETAARYALIHAVALAALGSLAAGPAAANVRGLLAAAAWAFFTGSLIFSGCLATLALSGVKLLGAVVPIGGVLLIAGWTLLAAAAFRIRG
jgi:uncharacterized membrane protein YgdD (TMEM256/DUF423 family)